MSTSNLTTLPASVEAGLDHEAPRVLRYYAWQLPVRICHWLIAGSLIGLAVTGIYIGKPFFVVPGEARFAYVMGTARAIHFYFAIVFALAVLSRIVWMFLGNELSSWRQFVPTTKARGIEGWRTFKFYTFLARKPPAVAGHNPLAGAAYSVVFLLYLTEIATGLALYAASSHIDSPFRTFTFLIPLLGGLQAARLIHHVAMWLLLAFAVHHVYSAWLVDIVEKNGTLDSIFSGYRLWHEEEDKR